MDPEVKRKVMIGAIVICLAAAIVITIISINRRAIAPGPSGPIQMLCTNPDCGKTYVMSRDEFNRISQEARGGQMGEDGLPTPRRRVTFTCPSCGQESGHVAKKCKKCANVFIGGASPADKFPDKCPACGYSEMEERSR